MPLNPEQLQPGALDENGDPLRIGPEEEGASVVVVDRFQAGRGSYLIVRDDDGVHHLLPEAVALEEYGAEVPADPRDDENAALRARIAELEGQPQEPAPEGEAV